LERTSRPVYAIWFLLPFIIAYELGTFFINTDILNQSQIRVVTFVWLQDILKCAGFGDKFAWMAPPIAVIVILSTLQFTSRKKWQFNFPDIWAMIAECIFLSVPLIVFSLVFNGYDFSQVSAGHILDMDASQMILAASQVGDTVIAKIITGIGAGIYEELVFRLILICLLMIILQDLIKLNRQTSVILAVLISAVLFSIHHHVIFLNGQFGQTSPFTWPAFIFRSFAGVYFAGLFTTRGFGITAGTHIFYDIIVFILNESVFAT